jgi:hypothetical protein
MPTKYVLSTINGDHKDGRPTKILIAINYKTGKVTR